ncbi:unnamed protein product [Adineta ricciae]|uniref:Polycystin cation channel PKD1/PKD2 domain-containing protein n=1 Tax=Adineta ricciae TaxID=249248 RepID=A0A815ZJN4_ADIRI|nr:unnamed protein product [Adineta ricciae]
MSFKFDSNELSRAGTFLGPSNLTLFTLVVVFICLSMFLSIINDNFRVAREKVTEDSEVLSYSVNKFLRWTGIRKRPEWEIQEERDQKIRGQYLYTVDALPLRTEQLVNQINRMCFNQPTSTIQDKCIALFVVLFGA